MISSHHRIIGALIVGSALVGGAFVMQSFLREPAPEGTVAVVTLNESARKHINATDSDGDGVPDWQDALNRTESIKINTLSAETYTRPDTLTDDFAIGLFEDTVRAKGYGPLGDSPQTIVTESTEALARAGIDELYIEKDIIISADVTNEALRTYGNTIVGIILGNALSAETENEAVILKNALAVRDAEMLTALDPIIASYESVLKETLATRVPQTYVKEHLDLINTYNAILSDIRGMRSAFTDPLYTAIRMKRYEDDVAGLNFALVNLYTKMNDDGIRWTDKDIVPKLISITE